MMQGTATFTSALPTQEREPTTHEMLCELKVSLEEEVPRLLLERLGRQGALFITWDDKARLQLRAFTSKREY